MKRKRSWLRPPRSLRATRAGWCFIAIIFGVGFAALNTGNNLLYLVLAMMLAFLVLSGLLSEASLRGIRVERRLPREIFARSDNRVVLRIHNDQKRVPSFAITIEDLLEVGDGFETAGRCFALRIGPGEASDRSYSFSPERRGDWQLHGLRISTRFPFGLFVKSVDLDYPEAVLAYPEIRIGRGRSHAHASALDSSDHAGVTRDGDDVTGLREFAPGDALSRVHWRRSLRSNRLLVGEREGDAAVELEVLLRLPPDAPTRQLEERVVDAASEVVSQLESGSRVGLRTRDVRFAPGSGLAHRTQLLSFLAHVDRDAARPDRPQDEARRDAPAHAVLQRESSP